MSFTVNIRTTSNQQSSVDVEPTITIKELKELISEKCGLGFCSALVFKGVPQRKDGASLTEINFASGDTFVGVFKAAKPAAAQPPQSTTPVAAETPAKPPQPTPVVSGAPVKAPKPATPPPAEKPPQVEWSCPTCTYINIPARTICEMCETPDPAKQKNKSTANQSAQLEQKRRNLDPQRVQARMQELNADQMDEDTRTALRTMVENDLLDEDEFLARQTQGSMGDDGEVTMDLEELLTQVESNPEQKAALLTEFGLPADASTDDLRQAILQQAHSHGAAHEDDSAIQQQLLQQLLSDPAMAAQLQAVISENQGDADGLQAALMQLLAGGDFLLGDEDDEDIEDDAMGDL